MLETKASNNQNGYGSSRSGLASYLKKPNYASNRIWVDFVDTFGRIYCGALLALRVMSERLDMSRNRTAFCIDHVASFSSSLVQTAAPDVFRGRTLGQEWIRLQREANAEGRDEEASATAGATVETGEPTTGNEVSNHTMVYLVSYDLRPVLLRNLRPFYDELQRSQDWWHYLDRTWLIVTDEAIGALWNRLRVHLRDYDHILIIRVTPEYQGWLPTEAWDWIQEKEREHRFHY